MTLDNITPCFISVWYSLWRATGGQIGREARAFMNMGNAAGGSFWAPVINLVRE